MSQFAEQGYELVAGALSTDVLTLFTQYAQFDELQTVEDLSRDRQVPNAYSKYADPFTEALLLNLQPKIEAAVGIKLIPTYSYYRIYRPGDELVPHIDRPACEISSTVCFGYNYGELQDSYQWPIWMKTTPVSMQPGDLVVYRGCEVEHYRHALAAPEGSWHVQAFFHYVDANGPYADQAYDRRSGVGQFSQQKIRGVLGRKNNR